MEIAKKRTHATIMDVAKQAGVSTATVSRVINQTGPVTPETAARVQAAIAELAYTPRAAARDLARGQPNTLGLVLPEIGGDFLPLMLRGIEAGARENGFDLLIYSTRNRSGTAGGLHRPLGEHNTAGLLVFTDSLDETELTRLYQLQFPLVLLHRSPTPPLEIPYVAFENKEGSRQLVTHLIETHHYQRIAFLRGPKDNEDSNWRERGYREALETHGLPVSDDLIGVGGFQEARAYATVTQWLAEGRVMDAIFAGDDQSAAGAIRAIQEAGRRVPEDIAVVGFDDIPTARYLTPPLTTVRAPIEEAGRAAAQQLIRLIQTGQAQKKILFPTQLVIRRSCGCEEE